MRHRFILFRLFTAIIFFTLAVLSYSANGETRITGVDVRVGASDRYVGTIEFPTNNPEEAYVKYKVSRFSFPKQVPLDKEDAKRVFQMHKDPNTVWQIEGGGPEADSVVPVDGPPVVEIKDLQATVGLNLKAGSIDLDRGDPSLVQVWNKYPIRQMRSLHDTVAQDKNNRTYFLRIWGGHNLPVKMVAYNQATHLASVITYPDLLAYLQGRTKTIKVYSVPGTALNSTSSLYPFIYKSVSADIKQMVEQLKRRNSTTRELLHIWDVGQKALDAIAASRRNYVSRRTLRVPSYQDDPDVNYRLSMLNHYLHDPSDCDDSVTRLDLK